MHKKKNIIRSFLLVITVIIGVLIVISTTFMLQFNTQKKEENAKELTEKTITEVTETKVVQETEKFATEQISTHSFIDHSYYCSGKETYIIKGKKLCLYREGKNIWIKKIDGIPKRYKQYILLHDKSNDNIFYLFCSEERFKIDSDEYVETYKFEINDNSRIKAKKLGKLYNLGYSAFSVFDKEQEKWYNFDEI